ncbi:23S rRNA (adenine(2503)-C(2))-methyltransferase RlmN [Bacteroidota bacterium]
MKKDIRTLSLAELQHEIVSIGEKSFRVNQIQEWLWNKSATSFDDMSNLSVKLRGHLNDHFEIRPVELSTTQSSSDSTIKSSFRLHDDKLVEGVLIPRKSRMTACISSQVGCSLSCKFCATGYLERQRNLDAAEIYDQVVLIRKQAKENYDSPLTNIVFMGMGEPLLNYKNVMTAISHITSPKGLGIASKRITLSTAGISKMIKKLADDKVKVKLALSIHAANDEKRNQIMPVNETNSLSSLAEALQYYYNNTKNFITFEYIIFKDFNDDLRDAEELFRFIRKFQCKVNIIEYNPIDQAQFENTSSEKLEAFAAYLENKNVVVKVRRSRGKDIDAACGQLANKEVK